MKKPLKNIFVSGAIAPEKIAKAVANHQSKTQIGAHQLFLGQVRADTVNGKKVTAIEYTAHEEMANTVCHEIREAFFAKHDLSCMHIYHSLGPVAVGEICFFVFVSSAHRPEVFKALPDLVDQLKERLPVFGKEIFEDQTHQWKVNK
ncbi:MAG: molybdenum cofactor biosynthesis protein MoaE [Flavobacteriaceae bacterium]|jgi:molybdopterin synthase catalytic subunit